MAAIVCHNVLLVSGLKEPRDAFLDRLGDGKEMLSKLVAVPSHQISTKTWGTSQDTDADLIKRVGATDRVEMKTLWGPPYIWAAHLSKLFPDLTFDLGFYVHTDPFNFYSHMRYKTGSGKQVLFDNFNDDLYYSNGKWLITGKLKQFLERFEMNINKQ